MKILVTGAGGFIGKNLCVQLKELPEVEIITFEKDDPFSKIEENIKEVNYIFHLAGINRPESVEEFYKGNTDLTASIINLLKNYNLNTPIIMTSSIQATRDNDYGKSKKQAEDIANTYENSYIYRLHNVFGKWCRPNYNSVTATFCYNVAHNIDLIINDGSSELELIYIDDIVEEFINIVKGNKPTHKEDSYCYISPVYKITLQELADKIIGFKNNMESILVPQTGDEFTKKLFSTYLSYVELDDMVFTPKMNIDERGSFTELIKTLDSGQVSVSISKPGIFRGNHYHHTKMEKFIVIKGQAKITFKHILTGEIKEYDVNDREFKIVNIPVGYTHKIENTGTGEMILLLWCNEIFDANKPDTYFKKI